MEATEDRRLFRLVHRSVAGLPGDLPKLVRDMAALAENGRQDPPAAAITGLLLHGERTLTQVLEGPLSRLEAAFDRISADWRHTQFELLQFVPIQTRSYEGWTATALAEAELAQLSCDARRPGVEPAAPPNPLVEKIGRIVRAV